MKKTASGMRLVTAGFVVASAVVLPGCGPHKQGNTDAQVQGKIMFAERLIQAGSYPEAEKMLGDAQRLEPNNPQVHYYFGVVHFSEGDLAEAEKSLLESLRLNKHNPDAHNVLGLVYKQKGDYQRALSEYQIALEDPTYPIKESVFLNVALCLDEMGKTEDAISKLRTAVEINPKYYPAHYELAKLLDRQDQTREAIAEYEVAAPMYASDPTWHYRLGLAYFRDRNLELAREHLTKVISGLPGSEKAVKAREYLDLMKAEPAAQAAPSAAGSPR